MGSNNKPNWRRLQERCQAIADCDLKKLVLHDAIVAIEAEHGSSANELIYPYEQLVEIYHHEGNHDVAAMLFLKLYLVHEINACGHPEQLMVQIKSMYEMGYKKEATYACNSLLYLLYETDSIEPKIVSDAWSLLKKLSRKFPEPSAKKLLAYRKRKAA